MPEAEDLDEFPSFMHSIENFERAERQLANAGKLLVRAAFVRRLCETQRRVAEIIAKSRRCVRIVPGNVRHDLREIRYCRVFDLDSEIHWGLSARTSSIDLDS